MTKNLKKFCKILGTKHHQSRRSYYRYPSGLKICRLHQCWACQRRQTCKSALSGCRDRVTESSNCWTSDFSCMACKDSLAVKLCDMPSCKICWTEASVFVEWLSRHGNFSATVKAPKHEGLFRFKKFCAVLVTSNLAAHAWSTKCRRKKTNYTVGWEIARRNF